MDEQANKGHFQHTGPKTVLYMRRVDAPVHRKESPIDSNNALRILYRYRSTVKYCIISLIMMVERLAKPLIGPSEIIRGVDCNT